MEDIKVENSASNDNSGEIDETITESQEQSLDVEQNLNNIDKNQDNDAQQDVPEDLKNTITNNDARLEQLEKEHDTLKSQYVRIAADFDNFRKRQSRDQDDLKIHLICKSLTAILPIVDNFERARQQLKPETEEAQALHRSYQGLYKQLVDVLKQQGVAPMRVVGQQFDPNLHEAVLREPSEEYKEDLITEELQRGYHLDGKVLRHALVKVSMGPGTKQTQDDSKKDKVEEEPSSENNLSEDK